MNWKVIDPASLQKKQHPSSHDSQASVPVPCTVSLPPRQSGNNYWAKNSEPTTYKKKTPVHGRPNTTSTPPPLVAKKVESNFLETGWPVEGIENETGGGECRGNTNDEGNNRLPEVQQPLPPKPPVLASGISSADRGSSGGVSFRGGGGKRGSKKGWGGGDWRKGGGVQSSGSNSGVGEPSKGLDRPSQFHKAQAQAPVLSKGGGSGGSTNSKTPPTYQEGQNDKAASLISSEVSSSRGRKPRISRRPNRGGKAGGLKQVSGRSDSSKRDNIVVATSAAWKGSSVPPQVANGAPT